MNRIVGVLAITVAMICGVGSGPGCRSDEGQRSEADDR